MILTIEDLKRQWENVGKPNGMIYPKSIEIEWKANDYFELEPDKPFAKNWVIWKKK